MPVVAEPLETDPAALPVTADPRKAGSAGAVQLAFQSAGARASRRGENLQRHLRDAPMYLIEASSQLLIDEARGQAELGKPIAMAGA
jgi:Acyl-CoA dehydrogenase, C-terminal domain